MSEEDARRYKLEAQREILSSKYRLKCRLLELERRGARVVYANQEAAALEIVDQFIKGKVWVVLVAPPGAGKTGVILEVLRLLGEHIDEKIQVLIEDMLVITGMSDTDWTKTMRDGLLDELAGTVHHRTMLGKRDNLDTMRNGIIVTDECHVACQLNQTIDKKLKEAGLKSIQTLKARNMRMLDVSATPEGVLADLKRWRDDTAVVVLTPDAKYKGFQSMKDEKRLLNAKSYDLENYDDAKKLLKLLDDRYKESQIKKYFPFRVYSSTSRGNIVSACHELGWGAPKNHDSNERIEDIDSKMSTPPSKHEVIFVKGFWRASKRVVRKHVGGTYESPTIRPDDTSKSQGLTARFCNTFDWDGDQLDVNLRPLHFDDVDSIDRYLKWWDADCNYKEAAYIAPRLRSDGRGRIKHPKTKVDPTSVEGVEETLADDVDPDPNMGMPIVIDVPHDEILAIHSMTPKNKRRRVLELLSTEHSILASDLTNNYECKQVTMPIADKQYNKVVTDVVRLMGEQRKPALFKQEEKKKNIWQCVLDNRENRLIVTYRKKDTVTTTSSSGVEEVTK